MTQTISVQFVDEQGDNLFCAPTECVPRLGETISYAWNVPDQDRSKWDPDAWKHGTGLHFSEWVVSEVAHDFRQYSINQLAHIVFVQLKRKTA